MPLALGSRPTERSIRRCTSWARSATWPASSARTTPAPSGCGSTTTSTSTGSAASSSATPASTAASTWEPAVAGSSTASLSRGDTLQNAGAGARFEDVDLRRAAGAAAIPGGDLRGEGLDGRGLHQVDGAPAEAGAGEPGALADGHRQGELDQDVELRAAHLVVVAQAGVRFGHEGPELRDVTRPHRRHRGEHPRVFGDDVATSLPHDGREQGEETLLVAGLEVAQRAHAG